MTGAPCRARWRAAEGERFLAERHAVTDADRKLRLRDPFDRHARRWRGRAEVDDCEHDGSKEDQAPQSQERRRDLRERDG